MNRYPFDVQKCDGTLEPMKNSDFFVKLVPKYLNYHGPTDLMKYQLETNISFIQTDNVKILCVHSYNFSYLNINFSYRSYICLHDNLLILGKSFNHFPTENGTTDIK